MACGSGRTASSPRGARMGSAVRCEGVGGDDGGRWAVGGGRRTYGVAADLPHLEQSAREVRSARAVSEVAAREWEAAGAQHEAQGPRVVAARPSTAQHSTAQSNARQHNTTHLATVARLAGARRHGQPLLDVAREVVGRRARGVRALREARLHLGHLCRVRECNVGQRVRHPLTRGGHLGARERRNLPPTRARLGQRPAVQSRHMPRGATMHAAPRGQR